MSTGIFEFNALAGIVPAWTTTQDGNHVTREQWLDLVAGEVIGDCDPLGALVERIKADTRKSFSKAKILELIEEFR